MVGTLDIATVSRRGQRPINEDFADFLQIGELTCCVLADGLGGHRGGEVASRLAVEAALASFRQEAELSPAYLEALIVRANEAILAGQHQDPALAQMRSTIVALVASGSRAVWGHVGDSRLYYLQGGVVQARTRDHSVSQALVDAGEVAAEEHGHHEDRSRLLRSLGKDHQAEATIEAVRSLSRGDGLLMCTDGFWEVLSDIEVGIDFCASADAAEWLARLETRVARRAGESKDNYTAIAVRTTDQSLPAPPPPAVLVSVLGPANARQPGVSHSSAAATRPRVLLALALVLAVAASTWGALRVAKWWRSTPTVDRTATSPDPGAEAPRSQTPPARNPAEPPRGAGTQPAAGVQANSPPQSPPGSAGTPPSARNAPADGASAPPSQTTADAHSYAGPGEVPERHAYRPATGTEYDSMSGAISAAKDDEVVWIGKGHFLERLAPIAKRLTLKGAGRDRTRIDLSKGPGLVLSADDGRIEDVELCCASEGAGAVLEVRGHFAGTIAHVRIVDGKGVGLRLREHARPEIVDTDIERNQGGRMTVLDDAQPRIP
jgi:serine/threonine protein phosphatase PrpC